MAQPVERGLGTADAADPHEIEEGRIIFRLGRLFLILETSDVLLEHRTLPFDELRHAIRPEVTGNVELQRKIDTHVARMAHRLIDPSLNRLLSGVGQPVHAPLRMVAGIVHLADNETVTLEPGEQGIQMARTEMDDISQCRGRGEVAREVISVSRFVE